MYSIYINLQYLHRPFPFSTEREHPAVDGKPTDAHPDPELNSAYHRPGPSKRQKLPTEWSVWSKSTSDECPLPWRYLLHLHQLQ